MTPWSFIGWLLAALLCLLIGGVLYGIGLLSGWPGWIAPALAGACLVPPLLRFVIGMIAERLSGRAPDAPLPVDLPPERRLPRWLLLDCGGLLPHLPSLLDGPGAPLHPEGVGPRLWSVPEAHWIAVDASRPDAAPSGSPDAGADVDPTTAPAAPADPADPLDPAAPANAADHAARADRADWRERAIQADAHAPATPDALPLPDWDALLALLGDRKVRRWIGRPAGIVLSVPAASLLTGAEADDAAAFLRSRLLDVRRRLGDAPLWLVVTGLETFPGLSALAERLASAARLEHNVLHAPLGWLMPTRRLWTPLSRWAASGMRAGITRVVASLDGLVRYADAGGTAPSGPAFLLEDAFRRFDASLPPFAARLGDDLRGVFWTALPAASIHLSGQPLFLRRLFREILLALRTPLSLSGARGRRFRLAAWATGALLFLGGGFILHRGAQQGAELLNAMNRLEASLPVTRIPALDDLASSFHRIERGCSGPVLLYAAPKERLGRLRVELTKRVLPPAPAAIPQWIDNLMIWAATRPGVRPVLFRAPNGAILTRVDGAATAAGRAAATRFLDSLYGVYPDETVRTLQSHYDAKVLAAWHAAGERLLDAVRSCGIDARTLLPLRNVPLSASDMLGVDNPCSAFLASAEHELAFAGNGGMDGLPDWLKVLRDLRRTRKLAQLPIDPGKTPLESALNLIGEPGESTRRTISRVEALFRARTAWLEYRDALLSLRAESALPEGRIRQARSLYGGGLNDGMRAADGAWKALHDALAERTPGLAYDPLPLLLMRAPLLFAAASATNEAARNLQERWTAEVVAPAEGLEDEALQQALLGEDGSLRAFAADAAAPFFRASASGLVPAEALGHRFPLSEDFLSLLSETPRPVALYPPSYPVRVGFSPVTTNAGATAYPRGVSLRMDCGAPFRRDVYNTQTEAALDWSPEQCGGTTLAFLFDGFEAQVLYDGPLGFARFAERALSGPLEFFPADFPDVRNRLEALGVSRIRTRFRIEGGEPLRERLAALPQPVVRSILRIDG